jgi:hypothetical protein
VTGYFQRDCGELGKHCIQALENQQENASGWQEPQSAAERFKKSGKKM